MALSPNEIPFETIRDHIGHNIVALTYGLPPVSAAIECETCNEVLYSLEQPAEQTLTPAVMWQYTLMVAESTYKQVLASAGLEAEITELAIRETAAALGIPMSELEGDREDAWQYLVKVARESAEVSVSLRQIAVLQLGERTPAVAANKEL